MSDDDAVRIFEDRAGRAGALAARTPPHGDGKPAFWWAKDREPWKRITAEMQAAAERRKADAAVLAAVTYVSAGASLTGLAIDPPDPPSGPEQASPVT